MKFCETCKNEYDDNTVFCTQCGARLTEKSAETSMLNNTDVTEGASEWEFSSRFLFRFAKEAKVTAKESVLTIQKSVGFIYFAVLTLSRSKPVTVDLREISSVTLKEKYSFWAGVFFFLALLCLEKEKLLAAIIFGIIGYLELKYITITINYKGGSVEFGDSNSISSEPVQNFLNYIRKYNPNCIQ